MQTDGFNKIIYCWLTKSEFTVGLSLQVYELSLKISFTVEKMSVVLNTSVFCIVCVWLIDLIGVSVRCLEYLLRNDANPALRDKDGYSAVHYASAYGHRVCLELVSTHTHRELKTLLTAVLGAHIRVLFCRSPMKRR